MEARRFSAEEIRHFRALLDRLEGKRGSEQEAGYAGRMLENVVLALLMAVVVAGACQLTIRGQAMCHRLWVRVLLRLVALTISLNTDSRRGFGLA